MDLQQHLLRQMAFSHAAFGPGQRMSGVLDHLAKEIEEVRESGGDVGEWVDLVILALDGLTRRLAFTEYGMRTDPQRAAQLACDCILLKQEKNEARTWPDWRTADPNKAIEHIKEDGE